MEKEYVEEKIREKEMSRERVLDAFWRRAINVAKLYPLEAVLGQDDLTSLRPNDYILGETKEEADYLAVLIVSGKKKATSSWAPTYEVLDIPLPERGEMSIVCDGEGYPQALIRNDEIKRIPFNEVSEEVSRAEGEGDITEWKNAHEKFFRRECAAAGIDFDPNGEVIVEFFSVLYAPEKKL